MNTKQLNAAAGELYDIIARLKEVREKCRVARGRQWKNVLRMDGAIRMCKDAARDLDRTPARPD